MMRIVILLILLVIVNSEELLTTLRQRQNNNNQINNYPNECENEFKSYCSELINSNNNNKDDIQICLYNHYQDITVKCANVLDNFYISSNNDDIDEYKMNDNDLFGYLLKSIFDNLLLFQPSYLYITSIESINEQDDSPCGSMSLMSEYEEENLLDFYSNDDDDIGTYDDFDDDDIKVYDDDDYDDDNYDDDDDDDDDINDDGGDDGSITSATTYYWVPFFFNSFRSINIPPNTIDISNEDNSNEDFSNTLSLPLNEDVDNNIQEKGYVMDTNDNSFNLFNTVKRYLFNI